MLAVVSDSSPLVYLTRLNRFYLLRQLFNGVFIPDAVWREVALEGAAKPEGANVRQAVSVGWLKLETVTAEALIQDAALWELGDGEREAIALASGKHALLIIDEAEGREVASRLGIPVTGTIGVLVEAKLRGLIPEVRSELNRLKETTNFRFSEHLLAIALQKAGEQPHEA